MTTFRHKSDTHGGSYKGSKGQDIFENSLKSKGIKFEKTFRQEDLKGIDYYIFDKNENKKSVSFKSSWDSMVNKNYYTIPIGSIGNSVYKDRVDHVLNSCADFWAFFRISHPDYILFVENSKLKKLVEEKKAHSNGTTSTKSDAIMNSRIYERDRKNGIIDCLIYIPSDELENISCHKIEINPEVHNGIIK